jgi:hypothetical protein
MEAKLDREEQQLLGQLCWSSPVDESPCDLMASLRLEKKGLIQFTLLGQWRPTPAGRFAAAAMGVP